MNKFILSRAVRYNFVWRISNITFFRLDQSNLEQDNYAMDVVDKISIKGYNNNKLQGPVNNDYQSRSERIGFYEVHDKYRIDKRSLDEDDFSSTTGVLRLVAVLRQMSDGVKQFGR